MPPPLNSVRHRFRVRSPEGDDLHGVWAGHLRRVDPPTSHINASAQERLRIPTCSFRRRIGTFDHLCGPFPDPNSEESSSTYLRTVARREHCPFTQIVQRLRNRALRALSQAQSIIKVTSGKASARLHCVGDAPFLALSRPPAFYTREASHASAEGSIPPPGRH